MRLTRYAPARGRVQEPNFTGLCSCGSWYRILVPILKFVWPFRSVNNKLSVLVVGLIGLVTLTVDFWPWNWCALGLLFMAWATYLPILLFLQRLFVLGLWPNANAVRPTMYPCDLDLWSWRSPRLSVIRVWCVPSLKFVSLSVRMILHTIDLLCER